jgi:RHS repeat-associated protein
VQNDAASRDNRYLYNGKELNDDFGLGWNDYGARWYDAGIGRWNGVDQMSEKYLNMSPYAYVANNPISFIDPNGMEIKDPDGIVKNYKEKLTTNKNALQEMINSGAINAEAGQSLMSLYSNALDEVGKLEKSDQVYKIFSDKSTNEGGMFYDSEAGEINIGIGDNNIGLVGHELHHAYQYEKGEVSIVVNNSAYGTLYDITDETSAFNRERALATGMQFFQTPNAVNNGYPLKMSNEDVRSFGRTMTPPAYQTLPDGPININSREGKALRERTFKQVVKTPL